ncbi:hypothetical protein GH714_010342 [Hevea brasiliensis]|uniref:Uncharacterized protein n=1 Tax=Hevea brasiliensis TaxID=3981 RepID=A0A6A6LZU6_HEVBR|nr:hypothetical protein GH714_010342 [Hevea brasiliensis]
MVEVKRAVPKELSPGPTRSQLSGFSYGPSRIGSFLNGYTQTQGYMTNSTGGLGVRMDGRFSPVTVGRSNFSPFGSGFGMGLNFEQVLSPSYGGNLNLSSNFGYGRLSPSYSGNSSRYDSPIGYNGVNGGNSSALNLTARTLWGDGSINHASNSTNSSTFMGFGTGNSRVGSFGNIGGVWASSANSGQGEGGGSGYSSGNLSYNSGDFSVGLGRVGYGRNSRTRPAPVSSHAASYDYGGPYADIYDNGPLYGQSALQYSPLEVEGSGSFGFGLGNAATDVVTKNSAGYVGGYSVANR